MVKPVRAGSTTRDVSPKIEKAQLEESFGLYSAPPQPASKKALTMAEAESARAKVEMVGVPITIRGEGVWNTLFQKREVKWIWIHGDAHLYDIRDKKALAHSLRNLDKHGLKKAFDEELSGVYEKIRNHNAKPDKKKYKVVVLTTGRALDQALRKAVDEKFAIAEGRFKAKEINEAGWFSSTRHNNIELSIKNPIKLGGIDKLKTYYVAKQVTRQLEDMRIFVTGREAWKIARGIRAEALAAEFLVRHQETMDKFLVEAYYNIMGDYDKKPDRDLNRDKDDLHGKIDALAAKLKLLDNVRAKFILGDNKQLTDFEEKIAQEISDRSSAASETDTITVHSQFSAKNSMRDVEEKTAASLPASVPKQAA